MRFLVMTLLLLNASTGLAGDFGYGSNRPYANDRFETFDWPSHETQPEDQRIQNYVQRLRGVFLFPYVYPEFLKAFVAKGGTLELTQDIVLHARQAKLVEEDINVFLELPYWGFDPNLIRSYFPYFSYIADANRFEGSDQAQGPHQRPVGVLTKFLQRGGTPSLLKQWIKAFGADPKNPTAFRDFFAQAAVHGDTLPSVDSIKDAQAAYGSNKKVNQTVLFQIKPFIDTAKPNAVFTLPAVDANNAYGTSNTVEFLKTLRASYDVRVILARTEDEVCKVLLETPEIEALVLGGHGTAKILSFGDQNPMQQEAHGPGNLILTTEDHHFQDCLKNLTPSAHIFLNSCSNGEGGPQADNLAHAMWEWSHRREVTASTKPFDNAYIVQAIPLRVRVTRPAGGGRVEDSTLVIPAEKP